MLVQIKKKSENCIYLLKRDDRKGKLNANTVDLRSVAAIELKFWLNRNWNRRFRSRNCMHKNKKKKSISSGSKDSKYCHYKKFDIVWQNFTIFHPIFTILFRQTYPKHYRPSKLAKMAYPHFNYFWVKLKIFTKFMYNRANEIYRRRNSVMYNLLL